jgi:hypothetical protein
MTMINTLLRRFGYEVTPIDTDRSELSERLALKNRRIAQLQVQVSYYKRKLRETRKEVAA